MYGFGEMNPFIDSFRIATSVSKYTSSFYCIYENLLKIDI